MSVKRYELWTGQLRDFQGNPAPAGMYVQAVDFQELESKRRATDNSLLWLQNREIELMGELAELRMKHREIAIGHCNAEAAWILRRNELEAALREYTDCCSCQFGTAHYDECRRLLASTKETPIVTRGQCPKCGGYFPAAGGTVGPHECLGSETAAKPPVQHVCACRVGECHKHKLKSNQYCHDDRAAFDKMQLDRGIRSGSAHDRGTKL